MAVQGASLISLLSGGASNTDPDLSLGSTKSSNDLAHQTVNYTTTGVTGITINSAWGFSESTTYTLQLVTGYIILGDGVTEAVLEITGTSGEYTISDTDASFGIQITYDNAAAVDSSKTFTVANPLENLFNNVSSAQSATGIEEYRCIYLENNGTKDLDLLLSLPNSGAVEDYKIGFDGGGVNATAVSISDENTAPLGVIFTAPSEPSTLDVSLTIGQYIAIWIQRILQPNNIYNKNPSKFSMLVDMSHV